MVSYTISTCSTMVNIYLNSYYFIHNCTDTLKANVYTSRTHTFGQLRAEDFGKTFVLCGWLEYIRLNRFIILRDGYGFTQLIFPENASTC